LLTHASRPEKARTSPSASELSQPILNPKVPGWNGARPVVLRQVQLDACRDEHLGPLSAAFSR
jgi:hypothetical protein